MTKIPNMPDNLLATKHKKIDHMRRINLAAVVAICLLFFGSIKAFAQTVPQPAEPPLWKGETYNDAVPSTGADRLHAIGITGKGVTAAVLDVGFYTDHEIFNGKIVNGFEQEGGVHGTHVAGIVLSMAPDSQLWLELLEADDTLALPLFTDEVNDMLDQIGINHVKISVESENDLPISEIFNRIRENAAAYNIVAINNSWGDPVEGFYGNADEIIENWPSTNNAIQALLGDGIAVVAASGNGAINDRMSFPEGLTGILSVGASNRYGYITEFSTQHRKDGLFLVAPGQGIYSASYYTGDPDDPDDPEPLPEDPTKYYEALSGTSMASPHVTGAVALLKSGARNATADEIIASLYDSADRIHFQGDAVIPIAYTSGTNPRLLSNLLEMIVEQTGGDIEDLKRYLDYLDEAAERYDEDQMLTNDWRKMIHMIDVFQTAVFLAMFDPEVEFAEVFVTFMEATGDLAFPVHEEYYSMRVDKAYMDLTGKRMDMAANNIDPRLSGILRAYANELRADINQDTADIFQRLDVQDIATQTAVARQMTPLFTNATAESAHLGFVGLHRSLGRRTELNRLGQGDNGCDPCAPLSGNLKTSGWIEGFGTGINKTGTLTNAAYDGHFAGTAFGIERKRGNRTFGFFGSWANHRVSGDGLAKGDWINFGVSGRVERQQGFLEGSLSYGYGDYDLTRYVFVPGASFFGYPDTITLDSMSKRAEAQTHAHDFSMRVAAGRDLWKVNGWKVGPRAEMSLSHLAFGSYRESGADSLNLSVNGYKTTYMEGGAGLFAGRKIRNVVATGKLMGMYGGMMGDDLSGSYVTHGSPYRVDAGHISTIWVVPEASLAWNVRKNVVLSGSYAGRFGDRYCVNTGSVAVNLYW